MYVNCLSALERPCPHAAEEMSPVTRKLCDLISASHCLMDPRLLDALATRHDAVDLNVEVQVEFNDTLERLGSPHRANGRFECSTSVRRQNCVALPAISLAQRISSPSFPSANRLNLESHASPSVALAGRYERIRVQDT